MKTPNIPSYFTIFRHEYSLHLCNQKFLSAICMWSIFKIICQKQRFKIFKLCPRHYFLWPSVWRAVRFWLLRIPDSYDSEIAKILARISANKPSFQNPTYMEHWAKRVFVGFWIDGLLAELQARMSRSCRISLFLHHNYQVSLICRLVWYEGLTAKHLLVSGAHSCYCLHFRWIIYYCLDTH